MFEDHVILVLTHFSNSKTSRFDSKLGSIPRRHYTFPYARYYMDNFFLYLSLKLNLLANFLKKKINVLTSKNLPLFSKMFFHGFNFELKFNKKLISMFDFLCQF